jgi:hypothetical protein
MTLTQRIFWIFTTTILVFLTGLWLQFRLRQHSIEAYLNYYAFERKSQFERILDLESQLPNTWSKDYSWWSELVDYLSHPNPAWAESNLDSMMSGFKADAFWVYNSSGQLIHSLDTLSQTQDLEPPWPVGWKPSPRNYLTFSHYFQTDTAGRLVEIWTSPIHRSEQERDDPDTSGLFVVARYWTEEVISGLSELSGMSIYLHHESTTTEHPPIESHHFHRTLSDDHNAQLAYLEVTYWNPELSALIESNRQQLILFTLFLLTIVSALYLAIYCLIRTPLERIIQYLNDKNTEPMRGMLAQKDEFGQLARSIHENIALSSALTHELEYRKKADGLIVELEASVKQSVEQFTRLSRSLFDGNIQRLFVIGLRLEKMLHMLNGKHPEILTRFQSVIQDLNLLMESLRTGLIEMELESFKGKPLSKIIETSISEYAILNLCAITHKIDADSIDHLPRDLGLQFNSILQALIIHTLRTASENALDIFIGMESGDLVFRFQTPKGDWNTLPETISNQLSKWIEKMKADIIIEDLEPNGSLLEISLAQ